MTHLLSIILISAQIMSVHMFYDPECCENEHCHQVPCEEISDTKSGWVWHPLGAAINFDRSKLKISPDGNCHVCVSAATVPHGICIYLPPRV